MAWTLRLSRSAEQDIIDILAWTDEHFGKQQALIYEETLALGLEALTEGPGIIGVKDRNDIAPGIKTLHVARGGRKGRHLIVFRVGEHSWIDIVRILHDSMEMSRHVD